MAGAGRPHPRMLVMRVAQFSLVLHSVHAKSRTSLHTFQGENTSFQCDRLRTPTPQSIVCVAAAWCGRAEYFHNRRVVLFFEQKCQTFAVSSCLNIKIFCFSYVIFDSKWRVFVFWKQFADVSLHFVEIVMSLFLYFIDWMFNCGMEGCCRCIWWHFLQYFLNNG